MAIIFQAWHLSFLFQIQGPTAQPMDRGVLFLVIAFLFSAILAHRFWRENRRLEGAMVAQIRDQNFYFGSYRKAWSKLNTSACLLDRTSGVVIKATPTWIQEGLPLEGQRLSTLDLTFETHLKALKPLEDGRVPTSLDITIKGKPYKMEALEEEALGIILVQPKH
ncbi:MAG: hypothetical protein ACO25G_00555 [Holophagaceae bacterium]|jgi:hypothetical protein|nr:hypothetical protein [Acidobacteriota bacterium]